MKLIRQTEIEIARKIYSIYGDAIKFWNYDPAHSCDFFLKHNPYVICDCTVTSNGFICESRITGGTMRFKNATTHQIAAKDVPNYCDPHENKYNDILDFCIIHYEKNYE
ncbi:uncharacterized protein LOC119609583 [Lucilia sericata]|uniref:uncharacterized protein LOC119609583 n=1 Tax=Lucilia sericata TaxID=13632 RepID=UPI0018A84D5B|nr:uncharacterized protein LOC119609583 [Lucilia sericata]